MIVFFLIFKQILYYRDETVQFYRGALYLNKDLMTNNKISLRYKHWIHKKNMNNFNIIVKFN